MPKKTKPTKTELRLPSREDLVAFIANATEKVGKREIARAFNIQGGDRIWLKQMLKELETSTGAARASARPGSCRPSSSPT